MKTLPHATHGWWGGEGDGVGEDRVLYVMDVDLEIEDVEVLLELEEIEIELLVEIEEVELEDE